MVEQFVLCPQGIELYKNWSDDLDKKQKAQAKLSRQQYYQHRSVCPYCSRPSDLSPTPAESSAQATDCN